MGLALLSFLAVLTGAVSLSTSDLAVVQLAVETLIVSSQTNPSTAAPTNGYCRLATTVPDAGRAEVIAALVRLGFHDAGPFDVATNTGGANGCLDFNDPDNAGLVDITNSLATIQSHTLIPKGVTISLADLWQYAALVAIWCSLPQLPKTVSTTVVNFPFQYGRVDASSCPYTSDSGRLPNAEGGYTEVAQLAARWGMTMHQVTALLGAHALGSTKAANSGFAAPQQAIASPPAATAVPAGTQGFWTPQNGVLDGASFYSQVTNIPWNRQNSAAGNKHSFFAPPPIGSSDPKLAFIMLNTDVSLFWGVGDTNVTSNTCVIPGINNVNNPVPAGTTNCPFLSSIGDPTQVQVAKQVLAYSNQAGTNPSTYFQTPSSVGQELWFPDFISSYKVLSELGYTALQVPSSSAANDAAAPSATTSTGSNFPLGAVIGAIAGGVVVLAILVGLADFAVRHNLKKNGSSSTANNTAKV